MDHLTTYLDRLASLSGNDLQAELYYVVTHSKPFQRYAMAVLDPSVTYGVKGKLVHNYGTGAWNEGAYALLDDLAARRLTGNAAKQRLQHFCDNYDAEAVSLLNRALNKDLRCGVGTTLINKLKKETGFGIPVFEVALAQPAEAKRLDGKRWAGAIKYDGMRTLIDVNDNQVSFWTRSGKPIPALQPLDKHVLEVFGGTKVMVDSEGVGRDFLTTMSELRRKKATVDVAKTTLLQCFDVLDRADFYKHEGRDEPFGRPLWERLQHQDALAEIAARRVDAGNAVRFVNHILNVDWTYARAWADREIENGQEGLILRNLDAPYTKARTYDWLKIKLEDPVDARITGFYEGEKGKKYEGMLGGVTVVLDGVESDVGGGWSDWERAAIWAAETGDAVDLQFVDESGETQHEVILPDEANKVVGRLIEVLFNGKMPSGAMRHARKKRFRDVDGAKA